MANYFLSKLRSLPNARVLELCIALPMLAIFFYGIIRFHDGPIRKCIQGYCGKTGAIHTLADYEAYGTWQTALLVSLAAGAMLLYFVRRRGMPK